MCQSSGNGDESNGKRMNYQQRLDWVVGYTYERLNNEIDLNRLASAYEAADAPGFESYLNSPQDVAPTELLTDICLPLVS